MKNKRRSHSAQFKIKVALAAAKGEITTASPVRENYKKVVCIYLKGTYLIVIKSLFKSKTNMFLKICLIILYYI